MAVYRQDRLQKRLHKQPHPYIFFFFSPHGIDVPRILIAKLTKQFQAKRKMKGWGCLCSLFITCLACTLPSLHLVSVVFGTAIPTSPTFLENVFHTLHTGMPYILHCMHKCYINAHSSLGCKRPSGHNHVNVYAHSLTSATTVQ